ncbi:MAG TPA: exosortase A [Casimicrobiaceae bacterium]|nr:exosortase A [Casimicrobiaceae bacterium]
MNGKSETMVSMPAGVTAFERSDPSWRTALPLLVAAVAAVLAIHRTTVESIVSIWWRSETFQHGFLVVPIVLWLIWRQRRKLSAIAPSPDALGLIVVGIAGAAWLAGYAGEVLIVKQLALVATLWGVVIATLGRRLALAMSFPLGFLILGVPMGEALIPPLMTWTADFTVTALRLTGIPVLRDGTFLFSIPSGNWSIVEGCSGVRYLIASFTVGVLFAYLSYRKTWKRLLFVALSIAVPILANGMRAYLIVMIAHLSDNKLAHGVDHFIYGWVFFGIVMLLLFWIGSFWRDRDATGEQIRASSAQARAPSRASLVGYGVAAIAIAAAWPVYAAYLDRDEAAGAAQTTLTLVPPAGAGGWVLDPKPFTDWRPHYDPASATIFQTYRKGDQVVALHLGYYHHQKPGAQLITSWNIMVVQKHPVWTNVGDSRLKEASGPGTFEVRQSQLRSTQQRLLIWDWFRIGGQDLVDPYLAKALLAWRKLAGRGDDGTAIIVATPYSDASLPPTATLTEFMRDMLPSIDATLSHADAQFMAGGQ